MSGEFTEIPVLDISAVRGGSPKELDALARQFREVYSSTGFGYVRGHGIEQDLVEKVFAASANFHAMPTDAKMQIALDQNHRGFIPIDTSTDVNSTLADVTTPNQSESFMMMREDGQGGSRFVCTGHHGGIGADDEAFNKGIGPT